MKKPITLIVACVLLATAHVHAGWFDGKEQQQLQETQHQLESQQRETGSWEVVAGPFAIGCVVLFTIGTAIGSRVRRHENTH